MWMMVVGVGLWGAAGCQSDRTWGIDTVRADRVEGVARDVALARDAQRDACSTAIEALIAANSERGTVAERHREAEAAVRRAHAMAASVKRRLDHLDMSWDTCNREWKRQIKRYRDDDLRRAGEERREEVRARYEAAADSVDRARRALRPVLDLLSDRALALRHAVEAGTGPPAPTSSGDATGALAEATRKAEEMCGRFIEATEGRDAPWARPAPLRGASEETPKGDA